MGFSSWRTTTDAAGLRFVSTGEEPDDDFIRGHPDLFSSRWNGLASFRVLLDRLIAPSLEPTCAALLNEVDRHDVLVAHHFVLPAPVVAELKGIPFATVCLAPCVTPSAYGSPGGDYARVGEGIGFRLRNRFVWAAGRRIIAGMVDPLVNDLRLKHGLAPVPDATFAVRSPRLDLQLYSEHFAPRPPDWGAEKKYGGFCFYDPPGAWTLAPEIEEFLSQGESPVLFTLGSTVVRSPGSFYEEAVKALEALGLRGILLIGSEENRPVRLPDTILAATYAPYGLLMPRVRAVAHQCGIGTLSHTLRARVPSVACPFAFDQPNNARRLESLGVAETILPHQRTARHLEEALRRLLAGEASARACRLGEIIRAEDGVGKACAALEEAF